jgi:folate-binding protein YgfZ
VSNDVVALTPGHGQRAAALTVKGRVIAVVRVFDRGDDLLVDSEARSGDGFVSMIKKFVNPRLAKYTVVTESTGCLGVYGDGAASALAAACGTGTGLAVDANALELLGAHAVITVGASDVALTIVRSADFALPGFDVIGARAMIDAVEAALVAAGWSRADEATLQASRIEAGLPAWGVEMNDETLAQEAALDALGAISFSKGCYTGQEVVARIHFRGHVNRLLRRLTSATTLPVGALVYDEAGAEVGDVRSSALSATRGALAIAMIRR